MKSIPWTFSSREGPYALVASYYDKCSQRSNRYSVRATVRSQDKADRLAYAYPEYKGNLDFAIVEDIAQSRAFDKAVISDPPFDYILHTASPFHFNVTDPKSQLIDPAVRGTTGILESTKQYAPSVKRVVSSYNSRLINYDGHNNNSLGYHFIIWRSFRPRDR